MSFITVWLNMSHLTCVPMLATWLDMNHLTCVHVLATWLDLSHVSYVPVLASWLELRHRSERSHCKRSVLATWHDLSHPAYVPMLTKWIVFKPSSRCLCACQVDDKLVWKLFVGGLSYTTTTDTVRDYFFKFGEITDCVVMTDPATKKYLILANFVYSDNILNYKAYNEELIWYNFLYT